MSGTDPRVEELLDGLNGLPRFIAISQPSGGLHYPREAGEGDPILWGCLREKDVRDLVAVVFGPV